MGERYTEVTDMRIEIVANKGTDTIYFKTLNEVEALIKEWELRMSGYTTKVVRN